jgi:aromatic-L-amino-acid/L-tryptophan decarboxylase
MSHWTREEIQRIGHLVVDLIAEHLTAIPTQPVFRPMPTDRAAQFLSTSAPAQGATPDEILRDFRDSVEPYPFGNGHPRFWGWVNSPPACLFFASFAASAFDRGDRSRFRLPAGVTAGVQRGPARVSTGCAHRLAL